MPNMPFHRAILLIVGFLLSTLLLFSCSRQAKVSQSEDTLDRIRRTGQIEACIVVSPPFVIKDAKTGALSGVNVDMMNEIASKINAKVNYHETTWGNVAADLVSGRCDVMSEIYFANIPRALSVAATLPADSFMGLTVMIRKNDTRFKNVSTVFDLDRPDITVSVATGEAGDLFVKDYFKRAQVKRIDVESSDLTRFCVEVSAGRADAAIAGTELIRLYSLQHPEIVDLFPGKPFSLNPNGWAVRQTDIKWLHFLETALQFLDTQGTTAQLEKKYNAHLLHLVKEYRLQ